MGAADASDESDSAEVAANRVLVETAMLAAVSGLVSLISNLIKMERFNEYLLPLPILISAVRSRGTAHGATAVATVCLLLVLLGPIRAISYALQYGLAATAMGSCWAQRRSWAVSIPFVTAAKLLGFAGYLFVASWTLNENLFALMLSNVYALLDQLSANLRWSGAPSPIAVVSVIISILLVNNAIFVTMLHLLFTIVLRAMGFAVPPVPKLAARFLGQRGPQ